MTHTHLDSVKRISGLMYEESRGILKIFLTNVVRDAVVYCEHAMRKTVTAMDVVYAIVPPSTHAHASAPHPRHHGLDTTPSTGTLSSARAARCTASSELALLGRLLPVEEW